MTFLRRDRASISNFFDALEAGLGKRGSSFTDLDAVSHDADGDRFLIREFKEATERLSEGQHRTLLALAGLQRVTVWIVRRRTEYELIWCSLSTGDVDILTPAEYQDRVRQWWGAA